jgi:hypothetical protein
VCVLAAVVGLSSNVVFLAGTVPASATAGLSSTFWFKPTTGFACTDLDMDQTAPTGGTDSIVLGGDGRPPHTFCSDTFASNMSIATGTVFSYQWWKNSSSFACKITSKLYLNTTLLGSKLVTIPKNSPTYSQYTFDIAITGFTFADGDRLKLELNWSGAQCFGTDLAYNSTTHPSRMVATTIVPDGMLALLLLAPVLPIAVRRRWIRTPWPRAAEAYR